MQEQHFREVKQREAELDQQARERKAAKERERQEYEATLRARAEEYKRFEDRKVLPLILHRVV